MKKHGWLFLFIVLAAVWLLIGGKGGDKKTEEKATTPAVKTFVPPEGAPFIELGEATSENYDAFYRAFAQAAAERESVICTRGVPPMGWDRMSTMDYGLFWLKSYTYSQTWAVLKGETEPDLFYTYHMEYFDLSEGDIRRMKGEIDAAADRILSLVPAGADDWETARTVHDELVRTVTYDQENDSVYYYTIYGPLVRHEAICQGYAAAFAFLMGRAGIYCQFSASEDHGWNYMLISGSAEEYVDCTWDDHDLCDANGEPYVAHDFFFLSREEVESVDSHTISTGDPYVIVPEEQHANYFYHEGYLLREFDTGEMERMLRRQMEAGSNFLEVRFETEEGYRQALALTENDCAGLNRVLGHLNYYRPYYYFTNDDIRTLSVGLYAPTA